MLSADVPGPAPVPTARARARWRARVAALAAFFALTSLAGYVAPQPATAATVTRVPAQATPPQGDAMPDPVAGDQGAAPDAALQAEARRLHQRQQQRFVELETLAERINESKSQIAQLEAAITGLEVQRLVLESELRTAQANLSSQARSVYMHNHTREMATGMEGPEPLSRLQVAERVMRSTANAVSRVEERRRALDSVVASLQNQVTEAQQTAAQMEEERRSLERQTADLLRELAETDPALRALVLQLEGLDEAARRAAYDNWLASTGGLGPQSPSPAALAAVRWALAQRGKPYQWGAEGPHTFDCSGLTQSAYASVGVHIPRVSRQQFWSGPRVRFDDLLPGDLVFYAHDPYNPATIHHVALYIGDGLIVHAPHTGAVVRVNSVWRGGYAGAVRVVGGVPDRGPLPPGDGPPSIPDPGGPTPPKPSPSGPKPPPARPGPTPSTPPPPRPTVPPPTPTQPPRTDPPTTVPPTTVPPTTSPPTTEPPTTTSPPTTEAPTTTSPPTTSPPTTEAPPTTAEPPNTSEGTTSDDTTSEDTTTTEPSTTAPPTTTAG